MLLSEQQSVNISDKNNASTKTRNNMSVDSGSNGEDRKISDIRL